MDATLQTLLEKLASSGASDLHLVSRAKPQFRLDGNLYPEETDTILNGASIKQMCFTLINEKQQAYLQEHLELDFSFALENIGRFRANYYYSMGALAAAFRVIPIQVPTLDELGAPAIYKKLLQREKGLILITGPTGSGKSTTLASMLNEINQTEHKHIITIEDPIEFIHKNAHSIFSHREVGEDTKSFATALKYALRQDPDIILVGEMRDKETIEAALTAAETGHLVFGTLHTSSAARTINRIIDVFTGDQQAQIRAMLSTSLAAIIAQSLLPKIGGGRTAVSEILITNHAIANLIRESKTHQIYSQLQLGQGASGMQTQSQALNILLANGTISREVAKRYANHPEEIK